MKVLSRTWSEWELRLYPSQRKIDQYQYAAITKLTVSPELLAEQYPLHRIEDIYARLAGVQRFSKIDLRQAYHKLEMEKETKKYLTNNSHMGHFQSVTD